MKSPLSYLYIALILIVSACDGRYGYLNEDQQDTVNMLIGAEWLTVSYEDNYGEITYYDSETIVYSFDQTGKGWRATGSLTDNNVLENVSYFQWTFTNDNYAVIYTAGHNNEGYWLIQKLTTTDMWLQLTSHDPVYFPNQTTALYKFLARKKS